MTPLFRPRRWVFWALAGYAVAAAALLLSPVGPGRVGAVILRWIKDDLGISGFRQGWIEMPANVLLFVPLGLLLALVFRTPWYGIVLAIVLSVGVELVQQLLPGRVASVRDIVANTMGAVLGAFLAWLFVLRRERRGARVDGG